MTSPTPTVKTDSDGGRRWYVNGELHRTDGAALEYADGTKEWWAHGEQHRADGPAVEHADGTKEWWVNGALHRTDGPAIEYADGSKEWHVNGQEHRTDGPACEYADGHKMWFRDGEAHRTDGAAIEYADGTKAWWVNGQEISALYSHILTAAFARGLPIPPDALQDMLKAMWGAGGVQDEQLNQLSSIIHQYWPMHVNKILTTLFLDPDPTIKHLAFLLLGRQGRRENTQGGVRL